MKTSDRNNYVAGVDIGGSHITVALINISNRVILQSSWCREAVNASGPAEYIIATWASVIKKCFATVDVQPGLIGIAMPGPFDYESGIAWMKDQGKFRELYGLNVGDLLSQQLNIPAGSIIFNNDASCFLQGELFCGVAKGYTDVAGLTLGTGFGSAIASQDGVVDAAFWNAPFKNGIAEDYLSGRSLVETYSSLSNRTIEQAKLLFDIAGQDIFAREAFNIFGNDLAKFLNETSWPKEPELIVLGGSISNAFELFAPAVKDNLLNPRIRIAKSVLGENAALIGAASMWQEHVKMDHMKTPA
jgi:glucokinase